MNQPYPPSNPSEQEDEPVHWGVGKDLEPGGRSMTGRLIWVILSILIILSFVLPYILPYFAPRRLPIRDGLEVLIRCWI